MRVYREQTETHAARAATARLGFVHNHQAAGRTAAAAAAAAAATAATAAATAAAGRGCALRVVRRRRVRRIGVDASDAPREGRVRAPAHCLLGGALHLGRHRDPVPGAQQPLQVDREAMPGRSKAVDSGSAAAASLRHSTRRGLSSSWAQRAA